MAFKAVKLDETFVDTAPQTPNEIARERRPERYDLATALRIVRALDTSEARAGVYEEIKAKNLIYRVVDALYVMVGPRLFQPLILFAYMLKCVVSLGPLGRGDAEAVSISHFPNEHKTVDRVVGLAGDVPIHRLTIERKHAFALGNLAAAIAFIGAFGRLWSFLRKLVRAHPFMPSARIASTLACYIRFSRFFSQHPQLKSAIVTSNYSPEAVAMAAAAHQRGMRVVYANHAPVPANNEFVPPVLADCALFYGDVITQTYQRRSRCDAEVALIGQPGSANPMEWRDTVGAIGIFLTAGTKVDVLKSLIASIRVDLPTARIIIRQHPVTLLQTDFKSIGIDDPNTELTIGNPLDDEIAACDLVICGNSGVAMNVLSGGRPVAYLSSLDGLKYDVNGFVASRMVMSVPWWTDDIYDRLKGFYQAPGWIGVMQGYDASYLADTAALQRAAGETLTRHLRGQGAARTSVASQGGARLVA